MEKLDIILEGAVLGTEINALTEAVETKQGANAINEFSANLDKEAAYYTGILDDISRKANSKDISAEAEAGKVEIKKAVASDIVAFKKAIKGTEAKYKYKVKYSGNVASEESAEATAKREKALEDALGKIKQDKGIVQTSNTVKACSKVMKRFNTKAKGSEVAAKAIKEAKYTDVQGNKRTFGQVVSQAEKEEAKAEKAKGVVTKAIDAVNAKIKPMFDSFKGELTTPSNSGTALSIVGALATYGVLYGALKGAKIQGLGSIINPMATVKLAIKVAGTPSVYGAGKSLLMGTLLTMLLGALSIAGTMVFNIIKNKFKK